MNKKLGIVLGAIVAVGLIASLAAGAVGAQSPSAATPAPKSGQPGPGMRGGPDGMSEMAALLNMTADEIWAARVQGKTLADLAKDKGVDTQKLVDILVANQKTMLDQAVADNRLTQAQADKWIVWYKQAAALQLTEPYGLGHGLGGGRGGLPGGMRGPKPGEQNSTTPPAAPAQ